jgi:hypothetical protein
MGTLAAFATFGVGFLFRPSAVLSSVISAIASGANEC